MDSAERIKTWPVVGGQTPDAYNRIKGDRLLPRHARGSRLLGRAMGDVSVQNLHFNSDRSIRGMLTTGAQHPPPILSTMQRLHYTARKRMVW